MELREITRDNWNECVSLSVNEEHKRFVASNMYPMAEAEANGVSEPFAVCEGDTVVGLIMYDYNDVK